MSEKLERLGVAPDHPDRGEFQSTGNCTCPEVLHDPNTNRFAAMGTAAELGDLDPEDAALIASRMGPGERAIIMPARVLALAVHDPRLDQLS